MKTVIEMAEEVGATHYWHLSRLEAFAELVRADERDKAKWDVHSCGPTCTNAACVAVREAVKAERLACAQLIENMWGQDADANDFAQAIRSRGQK